MVFIYCKTALDYMSSHCLFIVVQNVVSGNVHMRFIVFCNVCNIYITRH